MALQSSGAISINDIHIEAGGSSGTLCTINDSDIRGLISKASGAQSSFNEFYGASAAGLYNSSSVNHIGNKKAGYGYYSPHASGTISMPSNGSGWWNFYSSNFLAPLSGWNRYIVIIQAGCNFSGSAAYPSSAYYGSTSMTALGQYGAGSGSTNIGCSVWYCVDNSTTSLQNATLYVNTSAYDGTQGHVCSMVMFYAKGTLSTSMGGSNSLGGSAAISRNRTTTAQSVILGAFATRNSATGTWASPMNSLANNIDVVTSEYMHTAYDVVATTASTTTNAAMTGSLYANSGSYRAVICANMSFS